MSSKYDLIIVYVHSATGRIIKIEDYFSKRTKPIINKSTKFFVIRKSKISIASGKEVHNYGYTWSEGFYEIFDSLTDQQEKEITLEKTKLEVLEELWLDILATIENYQANYFFNPLVEEQIAVDKEEGLKIATEFSDNLSIFLPKNKHDIEIQHRLSIEGYHELCKRCYIMFCDLSKKIQESIDPVETFKIARRFYFHPIFEQTVV
jgi:hypothetical protein